jgi:hypothetical protein
MEALLGFDWISVRLEYTQHDHELTRGWYFVGPGDKVLPPSCQRLDGLQVRM